MSAQGSRLPIIYFGHGNPMNAILDNACTEGWRSIGASIPKPRAVLCVSAHWYISDTRVTSMERLRTIHDFGGFPANSTRSSTRLRATLSSPLGSQICCGQPRPPLTTARGVWITVRGPCSLMCSPRPTSRSYS